MKSISVLLLTLLSMSTGFSQSIPLKKWTFKTGYSLSLTQLGLSPFSEARRWWDRGVNSIFFNTEIQFRVKGMNMSTGLQYVQKGFVTSYSNTSQFIDEEIAYQYRLHYLELPINIMLRKNFIMGVMVSYLFDDDYRYRFRRTVTNLAGEKFTYQIDVAYPFPAYSRYKEWDFGINVGYRCKLTDDLSAELSLQKHFVDVDNWHTEDLRYNICLLAGLRYCPF